ncbi:WxL domain-containing protein [Levilactobacillus fuyuanensis]|uniref:WxL domain-containing protein n=1 Tax=Levilactobacillus fuyuanensis TaxID=2486022 RepID=A0ABW4H459_9LACO|nr:WxL domain-containing protein [Levilactobacillus fuyuanensis]
MKKTVSSILLASALLLGAIAPVTANAATTGSGVTTSTVHFDKPDPNTKPVDPDNPGTPVDPSNPGGNGGATVSGDLTFLYVSNSIDFGSAATPLKAQTDGTTQTINDGSKNADGSTNVVTVSNEAFATNKNLISEVSDTRGNNAGWTVQVNSSPLTDSKVGDLKGATLDLNGVGADVRNSAVADGSTIDKADTGALALDGTPGTIYSAKTGNGAGVTTMQLDPSKVTLSVPTNVATGTYTGKLNWTLSDTPGA